MRQRDLSAGEVYVMQRGPTRRALTVTLLDAPAPSGIRGRVMVRVEDGVGKGRAIEAPTSSLYPVYEEEVEAEEAPYNPIESRHLPAPADWLPRCGESVTWSKTGGIIFEIRRLTREGALIAGELLGMKKQYEVPFTELSPAEPRSLAIVRSQEGERAIEPMSEEPDDEPPPALSVIEPDDDWVEALIFSPKCIDLYRRTFARNKRPAAAEAKLRRELQKAKKIRPKKRGTAYLYLRVSRRFDIVIKESPTRGSADALYVDVDDLRVAPWRQAA
jgi:hypothetical protein